MKKFLDGRRQTSVVSFGHEPNQTHVNEVLYDLRSLEPLQNVRVVAGEMARKRHKITRFDYLLIMNY